MVKNDIKMKNMKNILMISLLALALAGCSKESGNAGRKGDVEFRIVPTLAEELDRAGSRAAVGTYFDVGSNIGLRLESSAVTLNSIYDNFYASWNGTDWRYIINGSNVGTRLAGFADWGTVKVMGYYPYNPAVTNFDQIPFRIAEDNGDAAKDQALTDYLVCETKSKQMGIGASEVSIRFEHLMTYLHFKLNRTYQGPALTLRTVTIEMTGRDFIVAGTYDAKDPDMDDVNSLITPGTTANKLTISVEKAITNTGSGTTEHRVPLAIIPQLAVADGGDASVKVTLNFVDATGAPFLFDEQGNPSMTFNLSDIDGGAGFLMGKSYEISATIGTYVHFNGVPLVKAWPIDTNTDPEFIEI